MRQAIPAEGLQSAREDGAGVGLILDEQDGPGAVRRAVSARSGIIGGDLTLRQVEM